MQKEETPLKKGVSLNFFIVYLSILAKFGIPAGYPEFFMRVML